MSQRFFGTDGLRGRANTYPMTVDIALRLGLVKGMAAILPDSSLACARIYQTYTLYHKYSSPEQWETQLTSRGVYCKIYYQHGVIFQGTVHAALLWRNRQTQGT